LTHRQLRFSALVLTGAIALGAMLVACSSPATNARKAVAASATVYAATSIAFKAYAGLPRCSDNPPPCSDPSKVVQIGGSLLLAHDAIDLARTVVNSLPADATTDQLSPQGQMVLEQAAQATSEVQAAMGAVK
jgi:hypothetical protein